MPRTGAGRSSPGMAWQRPVLFTLLAGIILLALSRIYAASHIWQASLGPYRASTLLDPRRPGAQVLVLYVFSDTDPQYLHNLRFFVREGVYEGDGCEYVFIVNRGAHEAPDLPKLPSNARYVYHANDCFDWGTFGWAIQTQHLELTRYRFFVFLNASVRGPFLPAYLRGRIHWTDVFISKITPTTKLVGPTINCEGSPRKGDVDGPWRRNPHVQSYVVATDQVGLTLLLADGKVFQCYDDMWDTIYHSEIGSSKVVLDAGYNIDSLMVRYQGVDWREPANWGCNLEHNPYGEHYLDGGSLEAMEVVFVKVKQRLLHAGWEYSMQAQLFDEWLLAGDSGSPEVRGNRYPERRRRLARVLGMAVKDARCFDCQLYAAQNRDLQIRDCGLLFDHYVNNGQFEERNARFICTVPADRFLPYFLSEQPPYTFPVLPPTQIAALRYSAQLYNASSRQNAPPVESAGAALAVAT